MYENNLFFLSNFYNRSRLHAFIVVRERNYAYSYCRSVSLIGRKSSLTSADLEKTNKRCCAQKNKKLMRYVRSIPDRHVSNAGKAE